MKKLLLSISALALSAGVFAQTNSDLAENDATDTGLGYLYQFTNPANSDHATANCTDTGVGNGLIWDTFAGNTATVAVGEDGDDDYLSFAWSSLGTLGSNTRIISNRLTVGNCSQVQSGSFIDLSNNATVSVRVKSSVDVDFFILASSDDGGWKTHDGSFVAQTVTGGADWTTLTFDLADADWQGNGNLAQTIGWELWFGTGQTPADGEIWFDAIAFGDAVIPNSTNEVIAEESFSVFPNPATDQINVNFNSTANVTVELMDLTGKLIDSQIAGVGSNQVQFNAAELNAGLYLVAVRSAEGVTTRKVLVK
jgi:hypothetical protein